MKFIGEKIFETPFWQVVLAENQTYLGYCVVLLKREDCGDLADVTNEEMLDFLQIVKKFESTLRKAFDATMFNWSCLMNFAYQNTPPDPHVHWHVKPRYNHPVTVNGKMFEDIHFGDHYQFPPSECAMTADVREAIVAKIKESLV